MATKEAPYFRHDIGARNDPKLQKILMDYGVEGVGIFWCMVEILYENGGCLKQEECKSIAFALNVEEARLADVLRIAFEFSEEKQAYYSDRVLAELESREEEEEKKKEISQKRAAAVRKRWDAARCCKSGKRYKCNTNVIQMYQKPDNQGTNTNVIQMYKKSSEKQKTTPQKAENQQDNTNVSKDGYKCNTNVIQMYQSAENQQDVEGNSENYHIYKYNNINKYLSISMSMSEKEKIFQKFFFRNFINPGQEVKRFYDWGESVGWKRANGQEITDRIKYASFWKPEQQAERFKPEALQLLRIAQNLALEDGNKEAAMQVYRIRKAGTNFGALEFEGVDKNFLIVEPYLRKANEETFNIPINIK